MGMFSELTVEEKERLIEDLRKEIVQSIGKRNNELLNWETYSVTNGSGLSASQLLDRCIR
jgi:hypothetical protein